MKLFVSRSDQRPPAEYDYRIAQNGKTEPPIEEWIRPVGFALGIILEAGERNPSPEQRQIMEIILSLCPHEVAYAFRPDHWPQEPDADGWYRGSAP